MNLRKLMICFLMIGLFYSCKEKTSYQLRILIRNDTPTNLRLSLLPKEEYMDGDLYDFSDIGGGASDTTKEIAPGEEQEIYITSDLKILPQRLMEKVFKSVQITPLEGNGIKLKFSPDTVIGYSQNLYNASSEWMYEIREFNLNTMFNKNPVESHDYIFVISPGKYLER